MNGIFEDPLSGELLDFVGGQADIESRLVRAIGDPVARLNEDHLRMLRAVRFASRFSFAIESATAEAIRDGAAELRGVSRERVGQEVRWMLSDRNRAVAAWELQYLGLDTATLLEPPCLVAPRRLGRLPDEIGYPTVLAAWLLDRAQAGSGPDLTPLERAASWSSALMLSNSERGRMLRVLEIHATLADWWRLGVAAQKRAAARDEFNDALLIVGAEDAQAFVDVHRRVVELRRTGLAPAPLIDGNDLIAAGYDPGPAFAPLLDAVYDAQLEGSISTPAEAIELARALMRG